MRFTAALVFLCVAFTACSKRDIPSSKPLPVTVGYVRCIGVSMLPNFPADSYAETLIGFPFDDLKVGDTVIFWDYTRATPHRTHHRLIAKRGDAFIAQGDNPVTNATADKPWVTRDNYIAKTTGRWALKLEVSPATLEAR